MSAKPTVSAGRVLFGRDRACASRYRSPPGLVASTAALAAVFLVSGCALGPRLGLQQQQRQAAAPPQVQITTAELPGSYGLASFHRDEDRERTVNQAKVACSNPYKIDQGPNGGAVLHLADQTQPSEQFIKVAADGQTFLGPSGQPGLPQDRLILSYDKEALVAKWMDPGVHQRYGTMVLVRCP